MTADMVQRLVEDIVSVTESLINQEAPFVANARADRSGVAKGGSVEKRLGSVNGGDDSKKHSSGTCASAFPRSAARRGDGWSTALTRPFALPSRLTRRQAVLSATKRPACPTLAHCSLVLLPPFASLLDDSLPIPCAASP